MAGIDTNTKLLLHLNADDSSLEVYDSSGQGHIVTPGSGTFNNSIKVFGDTSRRFDGSDDYLTIPDSNDFVFDGDFTVELRIRLDSATGNYYVIGNADGFFSGNYDNGWGLCVHSTSMTYWETSGSGMNYEHRVTHGMSADTWYHITIVRESGSVTVYKNGTAYTPSHQVGSSSTSLNPANDLIIGRVPNQATRYYFAGYMDEVRISKGTARWTENFTSPSSAYITDSYTKLLLHMDTFDESGNGHPVYFEGTAQIDTAQKKFGVSSLLLDGDSDYLTISDSSDWDIFDTGVTATVDTWIKFDALTDNEAILGQYADDNNRWYIYAYGSGGKFVFDVYGKFGAGGDAYLNAVTAISTDTDWHHLAFVRISGTTMGLYLDGNQIGYLSDSSSGTIASDLYIGQRGKVGEEFYFDGHIDELRIQYSNYFNASPNSEKTDTIAVPTREYNYEVPHAQTIIIT